VTWMNRGTAELMMMLAAAAASLSCGGSTSDTLGAGGAGGGSGSGGSGGQQHAHPSCRTDYLGAGMDCSTGRDCCETTDIPGGRFNRRNDPSLPASVGAFRADVFEVTTGRFRGFVDAWPGSKPKSGTGGHPKVTGTEWQAEWDADHLPATSEELLTALGTDSIYITCDIWKAGIEDGRIPASCMTWYEAFAFCTWEGGRLPTEAEWQFMAVGGDEQRINPWGNEPYDRTRAVYREDPEGGLAAAGSRPAGVGRWGVLDLGGSRIEWALDRGELGRTPPVPCTDCVDLLDKRIRVDLDNSYAQETESAAEARPIYQTVDARAAPQGLRCVYDVP